MAVHPPGHRLSRVLAVCAVDAEAAAVVGGLPGHARGAVGPLPAHRATTGAGDLDVVTAGVGPAAAAAAAGIALALARYDVVLSAGIAGAFRDGGATVGGIAVGDRLVAADLGVVTAQGFLDVATLGFGSALGSYLTPPALVATAVERCTAAGLPVAVGPLLTLSTFTGTDERAAALALAHTPVAEAMEGVGVATAAAHYDVPVLEVRAVSNWVGARDREAWDVPGALAALGRACSALLVGPVTA